MSDPTGSISNGTFDRQEPAVSIRRAGVRDLLRVIGVAAGAAQRNLHRRRLGRYARHRAGLQVALWIASSIHAVLIGSLLISDRGNAIAVVTPLSGRGTLRLRVRVLILVILVAIGVSAPLATVGGGALEAASLILLVIALFLGAQSRRRTGSALRRARRRLLATIQGPAVEVGNLASISPGAGMALLREICRHVDATGTTILADADGAARVRLYRPLGFDVVFTGAEPWAPSLLVRHSLQRRARVTE